MGIFIVEVEARKEASGILINSVWNFISLYAHFQNCYVKLEKFNPIDVAWKKVLCIYSPIQQILTSDCYVIYIVLDAGDAIMEKAWSLPSEKFYASRECKHFNIIYRIYLKSPNDLHIFPCKKWENFLEKPL